MALEWNGQSKHFFGLRLKTIPIFIVFSCFFSTLFLRVIVILEFKHLSCARSQSIKQNSSPFISIHNKIVRLSPQTNELNSKNTLNDKFARLFLPRIFLSLSHSLNIGSIVCFYFILYFYYYSKTEMGFNLLPIYVVCAH